MYLITLIKSQLVASIFCMSKLQRQAVKSSLSKKIDDASVVDTYENAIYDMCVRLAKQRGVKVSGVYTTAAFEKVGHLLEAKDDASRDLVVKDIEKGVEGRDSVVFARQKFVYDKFMDRSVLKPVAVKGVYLCKFKGCGSDEFYTWSLQTKSSDEPMTLFRECARCGKRGKE